MPELSQVQHLLDAIVGHKDQALIQTAIFSGMRRAEILGLHWRNINFDKHTISVRHTLQWLPEKGYFFTEPKSKKSRRMIVMPDVLVAVLKDHRKKQLEDRMMLGPVYEDNGLVFPRPEGQPENPTNISHRFKALVDKSASMA